ncbi:MAG TPA: VOC family protein [Dehalococcoidia bacterium]|jgi:PhnB protein
MLAYEDGPAALDWLAAAFGFRERARMMSEGRLSHGELDTGSGIVMLATPSPDYESPKHHREHCDAAQRWSTVPWVVDGVLVYVDDIDGHRRRAENAGAVMLGPTERGPPGDRYRAEDLEGHRWMFMQTPAQSA